MPGDDDMDLSQGEVSRLLCPNPYTCGDNSSSRPPEEVVSLFGDVEFLPDAPPGSSVMTGLGRRRMIALVNRCSGCNKLAIRCLNVSKDDLRVIYYDVNGMAEVAGASINANGRYRNLFVDAMVYASQALDSNSFDSFVICGDALDGRANNTFEVVQSQDDYDEID